METGYCATGYGNEHEWPDRQLMFPWIQVGHNHFRHHMTAYPQEHAPGNTYCHDNQADTENRIQTGNNLINRKNGSQEIISQYYDKPRQNGPASELGKKHGRSSHEHSTYQDKQDNREYTHHRKHGLSHVIANDFRNGMSIFTHRHHTGKIIMYTTSKNCSQYDPEVNRWSPECTTQSPKNRSQPCNIEQLDKEYLPGGKRNIIHPIIMKYRRSLAIRRTEYTVNQCAVYHIACNQCGQCY